MHNQLLQHGFQAAWFGGLRIATTSSAAGATARIGVIVQTGCGFLSGGRRGASLEDREDCYGRATVALTRAIRHTYIVSPIDMAGMIGMAQTLAVYHYGYHTLKNRQVQHHEPTREPSRDAEAVLEWGLDTPLVVWKGYRPRVRLVLAGGHASAWISPFWRGPAPGAQRYQAAAVLEWGLDTPFTPWW